MAHRKWLSIFVSLTLFFSLFPPIASFANSIASESALMITEIATDSKASGTDYFEYLEIYNRSTEAVALNDYKLTYVYTDKPTEINIPLPEVTIPANSAIVLWYNNGSKTKDEFRIEYEISIPDEQIVEFTATGFTGMANGGNRGFKLSLPTGEVVNEAVYFSGEVGAGLVKEFKYIPGMIQMATYKTVATPTPGHIEQEQVMAQTETPGEEVKPTILHTPVTSVKETDTLTIQATFQETVTATLHYETNEALPVKSIPFVKQVDETYTAEIPASQYLGDRLTYVIEAKNETATATFPENISTPFEVVVQLSEEVDFQKVPQLLITEITPDSTNIVDKDGYEFVEIYNNTSEPINMKDYQLVYINGDKIYPWDLTEDKVVPAQSSFIIWIKNGPNNETTVEELNANYGTNLTENEVTTISSGGMANSGDRTLIIADDLGTELSRANYTGTDVAADKGIMYKYSLANSEMVKVGTTKEKATPGSIVPGQVPRVPVQVGQDSEAPVITHTPMTKVVGNQPLTITATVTDNVAVQHVVVSYQLAGTSEWMTLPMSLTDEVASTYEAILPKEAFVGNGLSYKIEATDGFNTVSTEVMEITVETTPYDAQQVPMFLVTEVVPDSANLNGLDGYEFIEIYNNTNEAVNFKDYKIRYRYPMDGPDADLTWPGEKEDIVIPSGETLVFWIINKGNIDKTVADFNQHYSTQLVENEQIVKVYSDGMANGSHRGIVVATNTGHEIVTSYYNDQPNVKDAAADKGILYTFPTDGTHEMVKVSAGKEAATPGTVFPHQVPSVKVNLPKDTVQPTIEDVTAVKEMNEKNNLPLLFDVKDDLVVKTVKLFYKNNKQTDYRTVDLVENYNDKMYHYTIYLPEIIGNQSIEYYVLASDGTNTVQTDKQVVRIIGEETQVDLRLNVQDETILNKTATLKATSSLDTYQDISLFIDEQNVTAQTFKTLEKPAYFSFEVKKTNLFFKNGVTIGDDILHIFDDTINFYETLTVPIDPSRIGDDGKTIISIRSGTKVSPFDQNSEENRDDFYVKNIRLVLHDGTVLYDPLFADPEKELTVGDGGTATPTFNFTFTVPEEKLISKAYRWDTTKAAEGLHNITATEDNKTVTAAVIVDNSAPQIDLSVDEGKEYKGAFTIDATVTDLYSEVKSVSATLDGQPIALPYETASATLLAGAHEVVVTAIDAVGNEAKKTVSFIVVDEHPHAPKVLTPASGAENVKTNPTLSVEVTDPTNDALDVAFYRGFTHKPTDVEVKVYADASPTEPPQHITASTEVELIAEEKGKMRDKDGTYVSTESMDKFPYQRFEVKVNETVTEHDTIELTWDGKSLPDRKVSMYVWNFETAKWEMQQWKVAGKEDFTLTAAIQGKQYLQNQTIQVIVQDEIAVNPDSDYTFVWMSDTQYYSESYPHIYKRIVDWIAEQKDTLNIPYVFHTGDLVDKAWLPEQWKVANDSMKVLDDANIPYGVLAGNHDVDHKTNDYTEYYKYFGANRFEKQPYYGGTYQNNRGHYDLISVNGNDYIMVYMGWGVDEESIQWMNHVLKQYPHRMAILSFHEYLLVSGNRSPIGDELYERVVVPNQNVIAVLSGHYHDSETLIDEIDDDGDGVADRKVYQMLADYQGGPEGGQGFIRLLHVKPSENKIYVKTYSPYLDRYNYYDPAEYPEKDEFVIDLPLQPKEKLVSTDRFVVNVYTKQAIGETKQAVNDQASVQWDALQENTTYGWYVKVTDDFGGQAISDVWSFTTGKAPSVPSVPVNPTPSEPTPSEPVPNPEPTPTPQPGAVEVPASAVEKEVTDNAVTVKLMEDKVKDVVAALTPEQNVLVVPLPTESGKASQAQIPATLFTEAMKQSANPVIEVKTEQASYKIPMKEIELDGIAQQLGVTAEEVNIVVTIQPIDRTTIADLLKQHHLTLASDVIDFTVKATAGDKEQTIDSFTNYIEKYVYNEQAFNPRNAVAIQVNDDGTFKAVPTIFDGNQAIIKSLTNAKYMIVENYVTFKDMNSKTNWAAPYVETLASKYIIKGREDGTFGGEQPITRAQFTLLLVRALGLQGSAYNQQFKDVQGNEWFNENNALMAAVQYGIITGKEDGRFAPNEPITRTQAAAMLGRALQLSLFEETKIERDDTKQITDFSDASKIQPWAAREIEMIYQTGIMNGKPDGSFDPNGQTTRNQMAKMLFQFLIMTELMNEL